MGSPSLLSAGGAVPLWIQVRERSAEMEERIATSCAPRNDLAEENRVIAGILHRGGTTLEMGERAVQKWGAGLSTCDRDTRESFLTSLRELARQCLLVRRKYVDGELGGSSKETAGLGAAFDAHEDQRRLQTDRRKCTDGDADVGAARAAAGQHRDACGKLAEEPPQGCRLECGVHALNGSRSGGGCLVRTTGGSVDIRLERGETARHGTPPSPRIWRSLAERARSRIGLRRFASRASIF